MGGLTLAFGSITATFQNDIKKLVAYSTISQIGYLVCGCGFCCYEEVLLYLIIHALNKAFLFILVGYTVHFFSGNTDMRQMGGSYIYSFDLAVLFFGVCFNLAGLPYSAGFLGKEFLLFQVLRDDFLSLMVRGCWLVSFFFTPIYMFILVSLVIFGPKKGSIVVYSPNWGYKNTNFIYTTLLTSSGSITRLLSSRLDFTIITSRLTSYTLFSFWIFFIFFGQSLLSTLFNFNTATDTITSSSFIFIKQHIVYSLLSTSSTLTSYINFYIIFLTISAINYLINFNYTYSYKYFYKTCYNAPSIITFLFIYLIYTYIV